MKLALCLYLLRQQIVCKRIRAELDEALLPLKQLVGVEGKAGMLTWQLWGMDKNAQIIIKSS